MIVHALGNLIAYIVKFGYLISTYGQTVRILVVAVQCYQPPRRGDSSVRSDPTGIDIIHYLGRHIHCTHVHIYSLCT